MTGKVWAYSDDTTRASKRQKDLADMPDVIKKGLKICPVKWIDEVLEIALEKMPSPGKKSRAGKSVKATSRSKKGGPEAITTH